jgi:hypothetical protein
MKKINTNLKSEKMKRHKNKVFKGVVHNDNA